MSIWWSFHLRRDAASVPLARRLLLGAMETAGVDPDVSYELSVALTEACANAVEHGGRPLDGGVGGAGGGVDPARGAEQYRVTAYLDGETCRIEVADSGPGFPGFPGRAGQARERLPAPSAPDPDAESGRGLRLIEELADHVHFGRTGRGGALVSFDKIIKWRTDAPLVLA
ncbi:ATP-binding protein [Streptomyces sp. NPDC048717]|uniref:ATP-binding protein n=1 Tax=Streptomyces sp. NPDC048717 TaxID=3154928 RepID=UPI00342BCFCD